VKRCQTSELFPLKSCRREQFTSHVPANFAEASLRGVGQHLLVHRTAHADFSFDVLTKMSNQVRAFNVARAR
jgi:hypothetical protein